MRDSNKMDEEELWGEVPECPRRRRLQTLLRLKTFIVAEEPFEHITKHARELIFPDRLYSGPVKSTARQRQQQGDWAERGLEWARDSYKQWERKDRKQHSSDEMSDSGGDFLADHKLRKKKTTLSIRPPKQCNKLFVTEPILPKTRSGGSKRNFPISTCEIVTTVRPSNTSLPAIQMKPGPMPTMTYHFHSNSDIPYAKTKVRKPKKLHADKSYMQLPPRIEAVGKSSTLLTSVESFHTDQ